MVKLSKARAAALREEILDATAVELRRVGYGATALTSVAERCGLATSAIYNRFAGKETLVCALVEERLEPVLGHSLDVEAATTWEDGDAVALVDGSLLSVLFELQLAARHSEGIRPAVRAFGERRIDAALRAREAANREGRVRAGQDPCAQALLRPAADAGAYLLGLASTPPSSGMAGVEHAVRTAVTKRAWATPAPHAPAATRRRDPGRATPEGHQLDQLGEALVLSAADVFAEKGYDAATVADISAHAGVTTGAIYNRFSGKAGLFAEVVAQISGPRALGDVHGAIEALGARSAAAGGQALAGVLERGSGPEHARDRALRLESRHAARLEPEVAAVVGPLQDHGLALLADGLRDAQRAGTIRPDVDAEALAWWITAVPLGLWLLEGPATDAVDWAPTFAALLRALRTSPAGR